VGPSLPAGPRRGTSGCVAPPTPSEPRTQGLPPTPCALRDAQLRRRQRGRPNPSLEGTGRALLCSRGSLSQQARPAPQLGRSAASAGGRLRFHGPGGDSAAVGRWHPRSECATGPRPAGPWPRPTSYRAQAAAEAAERPSSAPLPGRSRRRPTVLGRGLTAAEPAAAATGRARCHCQGQALAARPVAELGRSGATRSRWCSCNVLYGATLPAVLPAVSYRDVRPG